MNKEHLKRLDELLKAGVKLGVNINDINLNIISVNTKGTGTVVMEPNVTASISDIATCQLYAKVKGSNLNIFDLDGKFIVSWEYGVPMLLEHKFFNLVDGSLVKIQEDGEYSAYGILIDHDLYPGVMDRIAHLSPISNSGNVMEKRIVRPSDGDYRPDSLALAIFINDNIYILPWKDLDYQNCQILIPMK